MAVRPATHSVCPTCLKRLPAERVQRGREIHLRKTCPEHGTFQTVIWRGHLDLNAWVGDEGDPAPTPACPSACGLCPDHATGTCCVVLEVTSRCNLACTFCLAGATPEAEPTLEALRISLRELAVPGKILVQLSGGEPTVREDLPEVIAAAKAAGCRYVQLNTNGIRLGTEPGYAKRLADAGLSFVFMQFDGLDDAIHDRLRGRALARVKQAAIDACAAANLGVTLVPTLVPGVNTHQIGDLLRFAVSQAPGVRGVHFQPVSFFGRTPRLPEDADRFTLDELVAAIEAQSGGTIRAEHLLPSRCDHPLCGFHGDFVVAPGGTLKALSRAGNVTPRACCEAGPADKNRAFVARRWERPVPSTSCCEGLEDLRDMGFFLQRVKSHGFTITAMAFQDAGNLDLARLRRCSLHVYRGGRFVPFCASYLTAWAP